MGNPHTNASPKVSLTFVPVPTGQKDAPVSQLIYDNQSVNPEIIAGYAWASGSGKTVKGLLHSVDGTFVATSFEELRVSMEADRNALRRSPTTTASGDSPAPEAEAKPKAETKPKTLPGVDDRHPQSIRSGKLHAKRETIYEVYSDGTADMVGTIRLHAGQYEGRLYRFNDPNKVFYSPSLGDVLASMDESLIKGEYCETGYFRAIQSSAGLADNQIPGWEMGIENMRQSMIEKVARQECYDAEDGFVD